MNKNQKKPQKGKAKKPKKKSKKKAVILVFLLILLFVIGLGCSYTYFELSKTNKKNISTNPEDLGISDEAARRSSSLTDAPVNVALFGIDSRKKGEQGRSDSIIIASVDKKHSKIKLISVMRDSRVKVEGNGMQKINAAYALGGPELAIKTLNQTFNLDIKDYATVDFYDLAKIIDSLGGVTIDVQKAEITHINGYMQEAAKYDKSKVKDVTKPGSQVLTGAQAVAYSRIRYGGGDDQKRTERQRTVLTALMNKVLDSGVTSYPSTVSKILPYVETSLSSTDIISIGMDVMTSGTNSIVQTRIPLDSYMETPMIKGVSYVTYDLDVAKKQINDFIYDDIFPEEKTKATKTSNSTKKTQ